MAVVLSREISLKEQVEELRRKLNQAIANDESKSKVLYLSEQLDKLIELHYRYYMKRNI